MSNLHELPMPPSEAYEAAIALSSKATTAGGATGVVGFLLSSPGIGLIGVVIALIGLAASLYFQWERHKREKAEHELRLLDLREALEQGHKKS